MLREFLIMARWRVFDKILHHVRYFKVNKKEAWKTVGKIAFWVVALLFVLHALSKHKNH